MKALYLALAFICISSNLTAYYENTGFDETYSTATVNISDEFPPAFPFSAITDLTLRTFKSNEYSRAQHGIYYPETFPNLEQIRFWRGNLENIDFESLAELTNLREIVFDRVYLFTTDQSQLFTPLQHKKNLTLIFYSEVLQRPKTIEALQKILPQAKLEFRIWNDLMY